MSVETACRHCGLPVPAARRRGEGPWFCCFGCRLARELALPAIESASDEGRASGPASTLLLRLGLGIFLALNVMIASWLSYSREVLGPAALHTEGELALAALASYLALFLCTLVVVLLGLPLLADSLRRLTAPAAGTGLGTRIGSRVDAQLLIVVGVFSAYLLSVVHAMRGEGSLYFDTAAIVLVVVTLGSYLEAGARQRATLSAHRLLAELPQTIRLEREGELVELPLADARVGDRVVLRPGEVVAVDGRIAEGVSHTDESMLTGEARPRFVCAGDRVMAGSLNYEGQLTLVAERVGDDTVIASMERALAEARSERPPVQRLADRVAAIFVPGVVLLSLVVFMARTLAGDPTGGLLTALSVLLISCPCALGLAAPLATWQGLRRAAESGLLVDSPATLERAAALGRLFLDKTGTLTRPRPVLSRTVTAPGHDLRKALEVAASLEAASSHPIADALVAAAIERGIEPRPVENAVQVPGFGVEARLDGRTLRLGSRRWVERLGLDPTPFDESPSPSLGSIYLMAGSGVLARFDLEEEVRPDAEPALDRLRELGVAAALLSGDRRLAVERLAAQLGLEAEGELLPADKVARARAARRGTMTVGMVGDGLNDAPVLAAADVGIAVGTASDLAARSGNVRLLCDRLDRIPLLVELARDVRLRIRANLAFAFTFNSIGIGLAVAGLLTPVFAALAMVVSSLAVVRVSSRAGLVATANRAPNDVDRRKAFEARPVEPALAEHPG